MRRLTKLRIDEVSLCTKGAGDGTRVLIQKNHDGSHRETLRRMFGSIDFGKVRIAAPDDIDDDTDDLDDEIEVDEADAPALPEKLEQYAAAICAAAPGFSREQALHFLMHSHNGRALARHLQEVTKRKESPMTTRTDEMREMRDFAKQHGGMNSIARHIIDRGETTLTEFEFSSCLMEYAKVNKLAGESDASAFSRIFSAAEAVDIRRAHRIAKNTPAPLMSVEPVQAGHNDAVDADARAAAYSKLQKMATELQRSSPGLSEEQSFARAFEANPELAAKAHRRPAATTSYAWPR